MVEHILAAAGRLVAQGWSKYLFSCWGQYFDEYGNPQHVVDVDDNRLGDMEAMGWVKCYCIVGAVSQAASDLGVGAPHKRAAFVALNNNLPSAYRNACRTPSTNLAIWNMKSKRTRADVLALIATTVSGDEPCQLQ
jgi:hypothetical protein